MLAPFFRVFIFGRLNSVFQNSQRSAQLIRSGLWAELRGLSRMPTQNFAISGLNHVTSQMQKPMYNSHLENILPCRAREFHRNIRISIPSEIQELDDGKFNKSRGWLLNFMGALRSYG